MDRSTVLTYIAVLAISFVGGLISLYEKQRLRAGFSHLVFGLMASCFVGYIAYEIAFYVFDSDRLSIAICAMASWSGTGLLLSFKDLIIDGLRKRL